MRRKENGGILSESVLARVGSRDADRWNEDDRTAQAKEYAEELELAPLMGGHRPSHARMCGPDEETVAFSFCEGQTRSTRIDVLAWMSSSPFARMAGPVCTAN